jgi:hypothetical protein
VIEADYQLQARSTASWWAQRSTIGGGWRYVERLAYERRGEQMNDALGRLWMLNRPSSSLVDQMEYYLAPVEEETDFLQINSTEELKVVDPACGSGHMLTYAFDLLYAIYEEEGYAPAEIPSLILTHNLYGVEIDPRSGALAAFALTMKARAKDPADEVALKLVTVENQEGPDKVQRQLEYLLQIKKSAGMLGIVFDVELVDPTAIHDRSITTDTGWKILLGRGLDIFQRMADSPFDLATKYQKYRELKGFGITYLRELSE